MADLGEEAFSSQMKVVVTFLRLLEELMRNKQQDLRYGTKTQRRGILGRMKDFVGGIFKKVYDGTFGRLSRNGKDYGQLDLNDPAVAKLFADTMKQMGMDAIMMWQSIDILCRRALEKYNGKLPTMVNFIFDEFANIGTIPDIEQTIAVTRSRNIGISIILQSVAQLESRYDKKAKTIIDCCDTTLFLGGKSNSTNKEISEMIGKQTINQKTFGETRGQSGSSSKNIQIQGRDLIDAAEIGKMNRREAILLIAGTNPLKDLKYPVEQHPNYIYLDPGRNKPGQVKNRCLYDEPFDILEYMDEIRTKDATYAS